MSYLRHPSLSEAYGFFGVRPITLACPSYPVATLAGMATLLAGPANLCLTRASHCEGPMDRTNAAAASLALVVRRTVHEILVGHTRLRVERDGATGQHVYFVNDQPGDVNAYLAVTQAHLDRAESRLRNH